MSDRPPNQIARVAAVGGVITMFLLVVLVIATSVGGSGDSGGNSSDFSGGSGTVTSDKGSRTTTDSQTTTDPQVEKAIEKGSYTVKEGDTLTGISAATGVDVETLLRLNPTTDPQILVAGTTLKLR